jgi:hypothetical protein
MNPPKPTVPAAASVQMPRPIHPNWSRTGILLALLLSLCAARADVPNEDYLAIHDIIAQADTLNDHGQTRQAHAKYIEAERALVQFQRENPGWNANIVSYRLNYLAEKAEDTSGKSSAAKEASAAPESKPAVAVTAPTVEKEAPVAEKSPVTLLDAGSEPRTVLRLHPGVGDQQTMTMTMRTAMTMTAAGQKMPSMDLPALVMTMSSEVKDVSADGDITYQTVFGDADVVASTNTLPAIAAAMKSSLASIRGMTGTGRISDHGIVQSLQMKLPPAADPQLSQTLSQMKDSLSSSVVPLPAAAVGRGAKWAYNTKLKSQGMTIDQTVTYELVSIAGDRITLHSTISQNAANQTIQNPAMPGLKVNLLKMTGNGGGNSSFDLGHILPVTGILNEKTEIVMGMNAGQQMQTMDMLMNLNVTLESK